MLVMGCDQNLRELGVTLNSRFSIFGKGEIREWQFYVIFVILSNKCQNVMWFHVKSLKLRELGMNRISHFRLEVKHDSVKC